MKQALVIFNGIKFSHPLAEKAIAWAKEHSGGLFAIFLAGRETEEQYPFPSDLDAAQDVTDKSDAEQSDFRVLDSHMQLLENMAAAEKLPFETEIMVEPSIDNVVAKAREAGIIFIDGNYEKAGLMSVTSFGLKELIDRLPASVEKVVEND